MTKTINKKRLLWGIIITIISLLIIFMQNDTNIMLFSLIPLLIGIILIRFCKDTDYYCSDCGQFLGYGRKNIRRCKRCGCNIITKQTNGVGKTTRYQNVY